MTKPKAAADKQTSFQETDLEGSSTALKLLAQKPKRIPPEVLVQRDYDTLVTVLQHGYTYTEMAAVSGQHGIKVTPAQLKLQVEALKNQQQQAAEAALSTSQSNGQSETAHPSPTRTQTAAKPMS